MSINLEQKLVARFVAKQNVRRYPSSHLFPVASIRTGPLFICTIEFGNRNVDIEVSVSVYNVFLEYTYCRHEYSLKTAHLTFNELIN
jgi:hypothetical protein